MAQHIFYETIPIEELAAIKFSLLGQLLKSKLGKDLWYKLMDGKGTAIWLAAVMLKNSYKWFELCRL